MASPPLRGEKKNPLTHFVRTVRGTVIANIGDLRPYHVSGNRIRREARFHPERETVMLVQGFVQTRSVLTGMERRLRRDGFEVFSVNLGGFLNIYNTRPVEEVARHIAGKVRRLRARHNLGRIHMVCHSKGGLVGRWFVQALGGDEHVKTLITLGTPHQGTPTAVLAALPPVGLVAGSGHQMLPHSPFIRRLAALPLPAHTRLVSIFSRTDLVCPYWCSFVPSRPGVRVRNLMVHGPGHTSLLTSLRVFRLIRREIRGRISMVDHLPAG